MGLEKDIVWVNIINWIPRYDLSSIGKISELRIMLRKIKNGSELIHRG